MKRNLFEEIDKDDPAADQYPDKVDKIYIRDLCAQEHFYNPGKDAVSILPKNGLFSPFFEPEFEE